MADIETELEALRQVLPDPFEIPEGLTRFFDSPGAKRLLATGDESSRRLLAYLENRPTPALARVATIILSGFPADAFYTRLLAILSQGKEPLIHAFSTGWWLIDLPEARLAADIVRVVESSRTAAPLFLLQHPAARHVKPALVTFIESGAAPFDRYALYAFRYALDASDVPTLHQVAMAHPATEPSALAGVYLLELGSKEGLEAIRAALAEGNEDVRTMTYYELSRRVPRTILDEARYDPRQEGRGQTEATEALIRAVR